MKRLILPLALLATVLALPATAAAFSGVVVAKSSARHAVVVASRGGAVRTVRAPARFRSLHVGQRLSYTARRLSDGTFKARTIRAGARARHAYIRGAVVRQRGSGLLLSTGGSLVSVRIAASRHAMVTTARHRPGDVVGGTVRIDGRMLTARSFRTVGHTNMLELEGIFLGVSGNQLRLAVEHRGEVLVTVPDGFQLPPLTPGDEIELIVSVDGAGAFTLVSVQADDENDDDGQGIGDDHGRIEVKGAITGIGDGSITVQPHGASAVTCLVPDGFGIAGFGVGDNVEMKCALVNDQLTLTELEHEDSGDDGGDGGHGGDD